VRYGLLLALLGDADGARRAFKDVLDGAELSPRHVRRFNQEWVDCARSQMAALG